MMKTRLRRRGPRSSVRKTGALALAFLCVGGGLAACGGDNAAGDAEAACERFPSGTVDFVVPYAAGGGFDAWARLMEPYLEEYLEGDVDVRVSNVDGGGGMRAMNQVNGAPPDGSMIILTEPGFPSVNQILGTTEEGFDVTDFSYLGQITVDPQIFAMATDSPVESLTELEGERVVHAGQDVSPIESITYDALGIEGEYVLHDSTSETILAIRRGDADATVTSLSSIIEYMQTGHVKPVLFIGTEEVEPGLLGYEHLEGVETIADVGHPELAEVLEQFRVIAGPPGMPNCMVEIYDEAIQETLADPEFVSEAEGADLRVIPNGAAETQERVERTYSVFQDYSDVLKRARS